MSKFGPETLPLLLWSCTRLSQLPRPAAQRSRGEEAAAAAASLAHAAALAAEGSEQRDTSPAPDASQHRMQGRPAPGMTVTMAGGAGAAGFQVMLGNGITMHAGAGLDHASEHGEDEQEQEAVQQPAAAGSSAGSPEQVQEALLQVACWYVSSRERMATMTGQGLALLMWALAKGRQRPGGGGVQAAVPVLCSTSLLTFCLVGASAPCCPELPLSSLPGSACAAWHRSCIPHASLGHILQQPNCMRSAVNQALAKIHPICWCCTLA
jgi:hypothetical protein